MTKQITKQKVYADAPSVSYDDKLRITLMKISPDTSILDARVEIFDVNCARLEKGDAGG